jgi:cytochrome bd-type quinol oxidase subunit 2
MKTKFLLPVKFKTIGWILLGIAILLSLWINVIGDIPFLAQAKILCVYYSGFPFEQNPADGHFFQYHQTNLQLDIIGILAIVGCLFVAFARLRTEDEYISKIRLESLVWATYVNFILLIIAIIAVYGIDFLDVMIYNMITILVLFIIRFHFILYRMRKIKENEK